MGDFIVSGTLPGRKADLRPAPDNVGLTGSYLRASDFNTLMDAVSDTRSYLVSTPSVPRAVSVKDFGARGDYDPVTAVGTEDDRSAFYSAICSAVSGSADGAILRIPPGNYRLSKALVIEGARNLTIVGSAFTTIYFPSDDLSLIPDAATYANSYGQVRSGLLLKNCRGVTINGVEFVGGNAQELTNQNLGNGVYATRCTGTRLKDCRARYGAGLFVQDATANSGYTSGNAISVNGTLVTLTNAGDSNGLFHEGMLGLNVTIRYASNAVNNGTFEIIDVISPTQLRFRNASAVAEAAPGSTVVWAVNDGDDDTIIDGCRWENCRGISITGAGGVYRNCIFQRPLTIDLTGNPDSFSKSSNTITLSDATGEWGPDVVGRYIKIAGATTGGNNGTFLITAATARFGLTPATLTYTNASGATELAVRQTTRWWISGGERSALGNGASAISSSSGVVTFTSATSIFKSDDVGKVLVINDATTSANSGAKVITRYISATQVQYVQSGATSEAYSNVFSVDSFDNGRGDSTVGPAISSSTTGVSANTLTDSGQTMVTNAYAGRILTDSSGRQWKIVSNTSTAFTLDASGSSPSAGGYVVASSATYGSTHAIYYYAGRSRILIDGCIFRGVRTVGVKISGSSVAIRYVEVRGNLFEECGAAIAAGADDAQEHVGFDFHHNRIINCCLGRAGWNDQVAITVLGARAVRITDNTFYASREAVPAHVNALALSGYYGIYAGRYIAGVSQPLEDVAIERNTFMIAPNGASPTRVAASAIFCDRVGQRAKWGSNGTLTKSGDTMTLLDTGACFSVEDVGSSIQICFAPHSGNNSTTVVETKVGDWTVLSTSGSTALTFTNSLGTGGGVSAGTYRIKPKELRGGNLSIINNSITAFGTIGISTVGCTGPRVTMNTFNMMATCVADNGSVAPLIAQNRVITGVSTDPLITLTSATTFPVIYDNFITNGALAGGNLTGEFAASRNDMSIGVDGSGSQDYPLRGVAGRVVPSSGSAENMVGYGFEPVTGDTFALNGTAYTYRAVNPTGSQNEFNSIAGLTTLLEDRAFETCKDYGHHFVPPVTTGHLRIRRTLSQVGDGQCYLDTINVLNPTAFVIPRNDVASGESIQYSRGEGSAGPATDRIVIWTMQASHSAVVTLTADNDAGLHLVKAGYRMVKNVKNAGCCEVMMHSGSEVTPVELRFRIT